jgi:hypothetical protein
LASPKNFEIAVVVFHAERNVVAGLKSRSAEKLRQAIGSCIQLGEGLGVTRTWDNEGDFVWV